MTTKDIDLTKILHELVKNPERFTYVAEVDGTTEDFAVLTVTEIFEGQGIVAIGRHGRIECLSFEAFGSFSAEDWSPPIDPVVIFNLSEAEKIEVQDKIVVSKDNRWGLLSDFIEAESLAFDLD